MGLRIFADTRPLQNEHYKRLTIANLATVMGAQLTVVAVPAQIYSVTGSSGYVGLTGLFGLVPLIIFGLYGGTISDAFDKRRVLLCTTLGMILCSLIFWALSFSGCTNVWAYLCAFSLQQAFFAVNQPTRIAVFPRLLPGSQLAAAGAMNGTVQQIGAIVGPLIAGALIPFIGYTWLFFIDALCTVSSVWAVWKLPSFPSMDEHKDSSTLIRLFEGFAYLAKQPVLLASFAADLIAMIFGMPRALFPELAHVNFGGPLEGGTVMACLYSALAVGSVLGGLFSGWVSHSRSDGAWVCTMVALWGSCIALGGILATFCHGSLGIMGCLVIIMVGLGGMADMWSAAFRHAILQQSANPAVQGRIQGVNVIVIAGGPRIADVLHGWAAESLHAGPTMAIGGFLSVIGIGILALAVPSFRHYQRPQD